jgi:hypothetical protein
MKKINEHKIDWELVSKGFGLSVEDTIEMFNDGRMLGRVGEYLHKKSENGIRQNENSSFDVKESNGIRSEIRSITENVSFASSKEVGSGRTVTEDGFNEKLNSLDRYILIDKRKIKHGLLSFIEVTKKDVINLELGKKKSISANKFFKIYDKIK